MQDGASYHRRLQRSVPFLQRHPKGYSSNFCLLARVQKVFDDGDGENTRDFHELQVRTSHNGVVPIIQYQPPHSILSWGIAWQWIPRCRAFCVCVRVCAARHDLQNLDHRENKDLMSVQVNEASELDTQH